MKVIFEANKVAAAAIAISNEPTRYYLNGVFFTKDGHCVGTDGHLLTVAKTNGELSEDLTEQNDIPEPGIIVPISNKAITALKNKNAHHVIFEHEMVTVRTLQNEVLYIEAARPIDGTFPDWKRVIPQDSFDNAPGAFGRKLLERIAKTSAVIGKEGEAVRITGESATDAHRVAYGKQTDIYSVVMPMRV